MEGRNDHGPKIPGSKSRVGLQKEAEHRVGGVFVTGIHDDEPLGDDDEN